MSERPPHPWKRWAYGFWMGATMSLTMAGFRPQNGMSIVEHWYAIFAVSMAFTLVYGLAHPHLRKKPKEKE